MHPFFIFWNKKEKCENIIMKQLLDNRSGKLSVPTTNVSYKIKDNFFVCSFEAYESSLNSFSNKNNDEIYNGDVVEVFLDLGDDFYYEFEVAPNGATFIAKILNGNIIFVENTFFESNVRIEGNNYFVKMKIDLSKLGESKNIKFNAFRIETKGIKPNYILQALCPTLSNSFHVRDKFVKI